ncbi:hypothetical protein EVAR_67653_1 [Eumeta japonica]|uniref:Uncharacterized protein n=1 Tax=Eumeta variegata TaxID=151549 RepID=A0A4C1ZAA4_EUMVA|nr:hypothetical protein EVAR_67653_1 [Eumeta japonica]
MLTGFLLWFKEAFTTPGSCGRSTLTPPNFTCYTETDKICYTGYTGQMASTLSKFLEEADDELNVSEERFQLQGVSRAHRGRAVCPSTRGLRAIPLYRPLALYNKH